MAGPGRPPRLARERTLWDGSRVSTTTSDTRNPYPSVYDQGDTVQIVVVTPTDLLNKTSSPLYRRCENPRYLRSSTPLPIYRPSPPRHTVG